MLKVIVALLLTVVVLGATACKEPSGSREYTPNKGWIPND